MITMHALASETSGLQNRGTEMSVPHHDYLFGGKRRQTRHGQETTTCFAAAVCRAGHFVASEGEPSLTEAKISSSKNTLV
jgi:hypothetical protein